MGMELSDKKAVGEGHWKLTLGFLLCGQAKGMAQEAP